MQFIWQNDDWLKVPDLDDSLSVSLLNTLESTVNELLSLKNVDWFIEIQKRSLDSEIFCNWKIEDINIETSEKAINEAVDKNRQRKNIYSLSYDFINDKNKITVDNLILLHDTIIYGATKGLRKVMVGLGRSEKELVYLAPPAETVNDLLQELCNIMNNKKINLFIRYSFAHLAFVIIHPFEDGNGRLAKLLNARLSSEIEVINTLSNKLFIRKSSYYNILGEISKTNSFRDAVYFLLCLLTGSYMSILNKIKNIIRYMEIHETPFTTLKEMTSNICFDSEHEFCYLPE